MIFVDRSRYPVPDALRSTEAAKARSEILALFESSASAEHLNQIRMPLQPSVWRTVLPQLGTVFRSKCAYCESTFRDAANLEVEHFRPTQVVSGSAKPAHSFYYAWLAYDWENLLLACAECNRLRATAHASADLSGKGGTFPISGERAPFLASVAECRKIEKAILIDPCHEDPSITLTFDRNGACIGRTIRGKKTIDLLGLNRRALVAKRAKVCETVRLLGAQLRSTIGETGSLSNAGVELVTELRKLTDAGAPFAGAARAYVSQELRISAPFLRNVTSRDAHQLLGELKREASPALSASGFKQSPPVEVRESVRPGKFPGRAMLPDRALAPLTGVEIENFNGIERIRFDIPLFDDSRPNPASCLVLLGENSSGKSSVLQAIALSLLGTNQLTQFGIDCGEFLRRTDQWGVADRPAEVRLFFGGQTRAISFSIDSTGRTAGPRNEQVVVLGYGPRRYFNRSAATKNFAPWECITTLFDPMATIPNPSLWLTSCAQPDFEAAVRALRFVLMLPDEAFVHRPKRGSGEDVQIEFRGLRTPINRMSDGYRSVFATAVDIVRHMLSYFPSIESAHGVVLIDELETHLHPRWKMRVLDRLRQAMPRVQFIVTTHDPLCLRGAFDGEVRVLERAPSGQVEVIDDLPNIQGLTVEQILASDCFGLLSTEDPRFEVEMSRYTALAIKRDRSADEEIELSALRVRVRDRIRIGNSAQFQLIYDSVAAFVSMELPSVKRRREVRKETLERMVSVWATAQDSDFSS